MKRIVVATPLYPPEIGGPATYAHMLEQELPGEQYEVIIVPFATARRWPKLIRHIAYGIQLWKQARDADLVYALDPVSVGVPACVVARLRRKTFWLRVPGDYAWEQGQIRFGVTDVLDVFVTQRHRYSYFVQILHSLQSWVGKWAEKVIVPSEYMKEIVVTWGVHPAHIIPIYSALHPLPVNDTRESLRRMLDYKGVTVVTAGRLVPWKGFATLIKIWPQIRARITDAQLVIIGEGPERENLEKLAQEFGVENVVRFVDRQPKQALGAAIMAADVFVLNTAYEGLSHQLLEVMDLGVPIVTTDVGGNPELIKNDVNGVLVPYDDKEQLLQAIERVATHEDFRRSLTQNARLRVQEFTHQKVLAKLQVELAQTV